MKLSELTALLPRATVTGAPDTDILSIAYDSRRVRPGGLFICLTGAKADGHEYVRQARENGAVAVLAEQDIRPPGLTVVRVPDTRAAMQAAVPHFFGHPGRRLRLIGVTGTNGKTTTTHLIREILERAGRPAGLTGTIHTLIGDRVLPVANTTPDVVDLQETLAAMVEAGMKYAVMEVSSHALELGRVAGCEFDVGVFTNLTRDHLDFHGTFERYIAAKVRLFAGLGASGALKKEKTAVINIDDPAGETMLAAAGCPRITYGLADAAHLRADGVSVRSDGVRFTAQGLLSGVEMKLKLTGMFNVYNSLAAAGAALAEGVSAETVVSALEATGSVPGRFERVDAGQPFAVIVDYAHTPDGLENVLRTAREFASGRIIAVFGCGGDRDRTKRPVMGRLAVEYGDIVVATSDNPRSEDPLEILREIEKGILPVLAAHPEKRYDMIPDRLEAIEHAIGQARSGDVVLIAGKGHENYQVLRDRTIPFDDREVAFAILSRGRREGGQ